MFLLLLSLWIITAAWTVDVWYDFSTAYLSSLF